MQFFEYNENKQRGSKEFPIDYHYIDVKHPHYHMPYHWHQEYEIIHILQGRFSITLNSTEYSLEKDDLCFISDGILHGGRPIPLEQTGNHCIYECIVFDMDLLRNRGYASDQFLRDLVHHKIYINPIVNENQPIFRQSIKTLFESLKNNPIVYELITCSCLLNLFGQVHQKGSDVTSQQDYCPEHKKTEQLTSYLELI